MHYILGHILFYGLIGSILDMTELLMCSGVSSIIQQLAELMSQARSQRQARARGQPGWPERQKVCIWNRAGTRLSWSSRSWRSTQAGPGPLLLLRGPHGELPPRKEQAPGLQNNVGQGNRCWSSLDLKIPKWGASRNRKYWGMFVFWAGLLIAVAIHLTRNILKTGFIGTNSRGTLSSTFGRTWTVGLDMLHQVIGYQRTNRKWSWLDILTTYLLRPPSSSRFYSLPQQHHQPGHMLKHTSLWESFRIQTTTSLDFSGPHIEPAWRNNPHTHTQDRRHILALTNWTREPVPGPGGQLSKCFQSSWNASWGTAVKGAYLQQGSQKPDPHYWI